jgi:hypothetical protein
MNTKLNEFHSAILSFIGIATILCSSSANGAEVSSLKQGNWDEMKLAWTTPAGQTGALGIPVGNGHIGARVIGGVSEVVLQLNDKWFWSGAPGLIPTDPARRIAMEETRKRLAANDIPGAEVAARGMWGSDGMGTYLPLGNLSLTFANGSDVTDYSRALDLDRSMAMVTYTNGGIHYQREVFASFPDDVMVMKLTSSAPGHISFTAKLAYPPQMEGHGGSVSTDNGNTLVMKGKAPSNTGWDQAKGMSYETRVRILPTGGTITFTSGAISIANADSAVLIIANATSYNGFDKEPGTQGVNPTSIVAATLGKASAKSFEDLLAAHIADYQSLFRRVWVDINDEQPNATALGFQYARYEMISSSRLGDRPHNQQGIWNSSWTPTSHSAHWLNENVEKYYGLIETANLSECGEPLWNWMKELSINGAQSAAVDWGFHGWVAGQCSDIWAKSSLASGNNEWAIWPMGGVWLCNNLFDHYAFTQDKTFLRDKAYPILKGASAFCVDLLVEKDGYLLTSPSTSPENRFGLTAGGTAYAVTVGSTMDMALIRELFANTIKASTVLDVDADFRAKLTAIIPRLSPFKIGANGELQEWYEDYSRLPDDPRHRFTPHRHASHIVSVWPLSQITNQSPPTLFAAAKLALLNRGTGGFHPDKAAMWARLDDGDRALSAGSMPTGNRIIGNIPPKYAAFPELFVQSQTDAIELLPALPTSWKNGHIAGLRARAGYELSIEWSNGQLVKCRIDSQFGNTPKVRYHGKEIDLNSDPRITFNK